MEYKHFTVKFMATNSLQISTLYCDYYGPAYTDTVGWLAVATSTMMHRFRTSKKKITISFSSFYIKVYIKS